jgi:hypothetical protein
MNVVGPKYNGKHSSHLVKIYFGNGMFSGYERVFSPFSTPWGRASKVVLLHRGVRLVQTDRQTGVMISKKFADKHVLDEVISEGFTYGGYICYGDDTKEVLECIYDELYRMDPSLEEMLPSTRKHRRYAAS